MKRRTPEEIIAEYRRELARKGGLARARKSTKAQRREWGKKGGRPRKAKS